MPLAFFFGRSFSRLLHLLPFPVLCLLLRLSPSSGIIVFRASWSLPAGSRPLSLIPFIFPMSNFPLTGASASVLLLRLLRLFRNACWSFAGFTFACLLFLSPFSFTPFQVFSSLCTYSLTMPRCRVFLFRRVG